MPRERWVDRLVAIAARTGDTDPAALLPEAGTYPSGSTAFATNCLPCHRLEGHGDGNKGPDLGAPMNVTRYITQVGFAAIVRDPSAVRHWPGQRMEGFPPNVLRAADLNAIWAYLRALDTSHRR